MILAERQAERELLRRGPEERRRVIAAFAECRDIASYQAWIYEHEAGAEEPTPGVLWARFWCRFWRWLEQRHASHVQWVRSLERVEEGAGDEATG